MGRGTTRRPKPKQRSGPSLFFVIALAIGVALLIWMFAQVIRRPVTKRGALDYSAPAIRPATTA